MSAAALLVVLACAGGPGGGGAGGDGAAVDGGGTAGDGGGDSGLPLLLGDPILTLGSAKGGFYEHVDAAIIDDDTAILVGQGGASVAARADGSLLVQRPGDRGYVVAVQDGRAWVGTKYLGAYELDLGDPTAPVQGRRLDLGGIVHQDLAFDGQHVLLSTLDAGTLLVDDATLTTVAILPTSSARGVALRGDRALVAQEADGVPILVLYDLSTPTSPVELHRAPLAGTGHRLDLQGDRVAVALGGQGAEVFSLVDDRLSSLGRLSLPGTTMGVALDGDWLWTGSWEVVGLAWLGEGGPVVLGHEPVTESAMGIAAEGGRAMVADWFHATALEAVSGVGGPELVMADTLALDPEGDDAVRLEVGNAGAFDLDLSLSVSNGAFRLSETALHLAPGARQQLIVTPQGGDPAGALAWTSNDPDEPAGQVQLLVSQSLLGEPHPDFTLQAFSWPEGELTTTRLSDFEGEVVFLAWWAEF